MTFFQQWMEIIPLHTRSILKLIQKEVFIPHSKFFIDKRCIRSINDLSKNRIGIINAEHILFLHQFLECPVQFPGNTESIELLIKNQCSIVHFELLIKEDTEILKRSLYEWLHEG